LKKVKKLKQGLEKGSDYFILDEDDDNDADDEYIIACNNLAL
jgi:hypothetical protein